MGKARHAERPAQRDRERRREQEAEDHRDAEVAVEPDIFEPDVVDDIAREQQRQRRDEVVHIAAVAHHERGKFDFKPHEREADENGDDGGRGQEFLEHLEVKAAALTRPAHKREKQELNKAGVDEVVEHDVGRAGVAKELGAHRKADEDGVRHRAHHHKNAELFARQLYEPADEQ